MTTTRELDLDRLRNDTPGVSHRVHLNNAGSSLPPRPVLDVVREHLELEAEIGGYEAADAVREEIDAVYGSVALLTGSEPRHVALVENATVAFAQALSAVSFEAGDVILTTRADYTSNQIMYLSLRDRFGVETVRASDAPEGGVDLDALEDLLDAHRPRLVALSWMPSHSGLVQLVAEVGQLCRKWGALYLVDACQAVGQTPIQVDEIGCDFLAATGRKFLRAPRGTGFLVVSDRVLEEGLVPLLPDLHGAEWTGPDAWQPRPDATRFENWEFSYALLRGLGRAADYALEIGLDAIETRARDLATHARRRLSEVPGIRCLDRGPDLSAICSFHVGTEAWQGSGKDLQNHLRELGVNTSIADASHVRLDLDEEGIPWALRVSPHAYNTREEIEILADALR